MGHARLFDTYVVVDWSAAARPVTGANSIWIGMRTRAGEAEAFESVNPPTRADAYAWLRDQLSDRTGRGETVLVGFDFALGYPQGTAAAAGIAAPGQAPWKAINTYLSAQISDQSDNQNNRFAAAADLNRRIGETAHPFWGAPPRQVCKTLAARKGRFSTPGSLPEHRLSEAWIRETFGARPKSVWQLLGAGAVGSQTLLGIPVLERLRADIETSRIWPFETGFKPLGPADLETVSCVFAEIYPATLGRLPESEDPADLIQVRSLSDHLKTLDESGELGAAFGPPDSLDRRKISVIESEEGWILAK